MIPEQLGHYHLIDVLLTQTEWTHGQNIGAQRNDTNRRAHRTDMKVDSDGAAIHIQGAIGEVAVARYCGLPITEVRDTKPFKGADLRTSFGTVAIKCRNADQRYLGGFLKSPHLARECSADYACLTWIVSEAERRVRIVGFLHKTAFNRYVKRASEYGVKMKKDGWYVPWQMFCGQSKDTLHLTHSL